MAISVSQADLFGGVMMVDGEVPKKKKKKVRIAYRMSVNMIIFVSYSLNFNVISLQS